MYEMCACMCEFMVAAYRWEIIYFIRFLKMFLLELKKSLIYKIEKQKNGHANDSTNELNNTDQ